jgi:hypothetical protein
MVASFAVGHHSFKKLTYYIGGIKMNRLLFTILIAVLITVASYAQPTGWEVKSSDFEYSMTITAIVEINGTLLKDTGDFVAAFQGEECRGVAACAIEEGRDSVYVYLTIFSNSFQGEEINFRFYNATNDSNIEISNTLSFADGENIGTVSSPYCLSNGTTNNIEHDELVSVSIYPNPCTKKINISLNGNSLKEVVVSDVTGKMFYCDSNIGNKQHMVLNVNDYPCGIYYVSFRDHRDNSWTKRIVIQ